MFSLEQTQAWTLTRRAPAYVARVKSETEIRDAFAEARRRGLTVTPRGAGYSYADEILNPGGAVIDTSGMNRILSWNAETGVLVVEPGVTFADALKTCLPDSWVVPAVPGIRMPTLGGAVSNNVHGKNAWRDGALGEWVKQFTLLGSDGRTHVCSPDENTELFHAAIGGLGLFGVFTEIVLQCKRIPSPYVEVRMWSVPNLENMLEDFRAVRDKVDYHIGWMDCFTTGSAMGRGTVHVAEFVDRPVSAGSNGHYGPVSPYMFGVFPRTWIWPIVKPVFGNRMMQLVNFAKFHVDRATARGSRVQNFYEFNFLLDKIPEWRQLFAPHGYVELEPVLPFDNAPAALRRIIELTQRFGCPSYLCGVKSHRRDDFMLSFSGDGISFGIDIPIEPHRRRELRKLYDGMSEIVIGAGGRVYLAKDELLDRRHFQVMYPDWRRFRDVKDRVDPDGLLQSDMYRRLFDGAAEGRA